MACLKLMVLAFAFANLLAVCFSQSESELEHKAEIKQDYGDEGGSLKLLEQSLHVPNSRGQTCTCQELQSELKHLNKEVKRRLDALERRSLEERDDVLNQSKRMPEEVGSVSDGSGSNIAGINIRVAFSTYICPKGVYVYPPNSTLKFDVVLTNEGKAYDVETGEFTVPIDGLYFFSFSQVGSLMEIEVTTFVLTIDGKEVLAGGARNANMGGNAAVLRVFKGQKVRVQTDPIQKTICISAWSYGLTSLSGFLLHAL